MVSFRCCDAMMAVKSWKWLRDLLSLLLLVLLLLLLIAGELYNSCETSNMEFSAIIW